MQLATLTAVIATCLILFRLAAELWLGWLNRRFVLKYAVGVPTELSGVIDSETYARSVAYTLAKSRFGQWEKIHGTAILLLALFSGVLPGLDRAMAHSLGISAWSAAVFLFVVGMAMTLPGMPFDWHAQFHLEERFGFNTTTPKIWILDRLKALLLSLVLGYPLLVLVLKLFQWTGAAWWLWAWGAMLGFQIIMMALAPVLILPLFNRLTPLPDGSLRERLMQLADRTDFAAKDIQVMDGSKRSRHSNAFFTGIGRLRKIILFDTLIQQLSEPELEAVLAHEIGHYKKRHIPKMLLFSATGSLIGFYAVSVLVRQPCFYQAFGFDAGNIAPALLLFALLSGAVTFWFSPVTHWWSRRYEYQADAFASNMMKEPLSLIRALRKLNEKNLGNLTPHPLYSGFYHSHPAMLEREHALLQT